MSIVIDPRIGKTLHASACIDPEEGTCVCVCGLEDSDPDPRLPD